MVLFIFSDQACNLLSPCLGVTSVQCRIACAEFVLMIVTNSGVETNPLIEFKGVYYKNAVDEAQSVLVQFDGVLLHVCHMSNPFYRLLTSDVFRLPASFGKGARYIKLPNGGRIETDNADALSTIRSNRRDEIGCPDSDALPMGHAIVLLCCCALLLGVCAAKIFL